MPVTDIFGNPLGSETITGSGLILNNNSAGWGSARTQHGMGWASGKMCMSITANNQTGGEAHMGLGDSSSTCMTSASYPPQPTGDTHSNGNYVAYGFLGALAVDWLNKQYWLMGNWGAGVWNGNAAYSPQAGTGGISIASFVPPVYLFFCQWCNNNVHVTMDLTSPVAGCSGFTSWYTSIPSEIDCSIYL